MSDIPNISIRVIDKNKIILSQSQGADLVSLVHNQEYNIGDRIVIEISSPRRFLIIKFDDTMSPAFVYMKNSNFSFVVPFNAGKDCYNPKSFSSNLHLIFARFATVDEIKCYKNLALNEYDCHENSCCFPHAYANVETRGESIFAAQNVINGNIENHSHGIWPYESWGINQDPNAEITVDFSREIETDKVVLITRADFPHDSWWKSGELFFSDGTSLIIDMQKSDLPHTFTFEKRKTSYVKLGKLIKDKNDSSPFPALSQFEVYGTEYNAKC